MTKWLFGSPRTPEDVELFRDKIVPKHANIYADTADSLAKRLEWMASCLAKDWDIAKRTGRWGSGIKPPKRFVPGDVSGLRVLLSGPVEQVMYEQPKDSPDAVTLIEHAVNLYEATPFWMDAQFAFGVMASNPPDMALLDELRLPFKKVSIFFNRPMQIPADTIIPPDVVSRKTNLWTAKYSAGHIADRIAKNQAWLVGVILFSKSSGVGLSDYCQWLLAVGDANGDIHYGHDGWGQTQGWLARSQIGPLAYNLAAAVGWGPWKDPEPIPDEYLRAETDREVRKAFKKSKVKKAEERGAFASVHVINIKRSDYVRSDPVGTHASPIPHLRRGHTRRTRCGPRDDWWYETRWIPPCIVNATSQTDIDRVALYRLPKPHEVGDQGEQQASA